MARVIHRGTRRTDPIGGCNRVGMEDIRADADRLERDRGRLIDELLRVQSDGMAEERERAARMLAEIRGGNG